MSDVTYWIKKAENIALVRVSDTVVQGWQAKGNYEDRDFEHRHFQTTYPSKERLDEDLRQYTPSSVEEFIDIQVLQHQYDDHFREKMNAYKTRRFNQETEESPDASSGRK